MKQLLSALPWMLAMIPVSWSLARSASWNGSWRTRVDLPLVVGSGLAGGALLAWVFGPLFSAEYPLSGSDFSQYCELVGSLAQAGGEGMVGQRSRIVGLVVAQGARWIGIVPAMAAFSLLATALACSAVFLWAWSLHGRTAGLLAVLLMGSWAPLGILARDITFYPFFVACTALSAAGVGVTFRFRGALSPLLAGVGLGLLLVADVRGILWALALLPLALAGTLGFARDPRTSLVRLGVLCIPLVLSWVVAHGVIPPQTPGIGNVSFRYVETAVEVAGARGAWTPALPVTGEPERDFIWGHGDIVSLVESLRFLARLSAGVPDEVHRWAAREPQRVHQVQLLLPVLLGALVAVVAFLRRDRLRLLVFLGTVGPFAAMLWTALRVLPQARFLATGMIAAPVVLGVALAVVVEAPVELRTRLRFPWGLPGRCVVGLAITALAVADVPARLLGLDAEWRWSPAGQSEPQNTIEALECGRLLEPSRCAVLLLWDLERGKSVRTPLYSYVRPREP